MCEITTIFFHFCFVYIIIYGIVMNKPRIWLPLRNLVIYFFYFNYIKQLLRSTNLYISAKYFIYYGLYVQIFLFNHAIVLRNSLTTHFSSTEARDYSFSPSKGCEFAKHNTFLKTRKKMTKYSTKNLEKNAVEIGFKTNTCNR